MNYLMAASHAGEGLGGGVRSELAPDVAQFIDRYLDSIPELEALLLLQETAPKAWDIVSLARRLYVRQEEVEYILAKLRRHGLAAGDEMRGFQFNAGSPAAAQVARVVSTYRSQLSAVTRAVHAKPPVGVREFARAFDLKPGRRK